MSFQQGLSGLSAASKNLEVIGNNVANSNTYGEKTSRTEFADMYANAMTGSTANNTDAGIGVQVASVSQQFNQGNITPTGNPLDLAINGNGFFQTQDPSNQTQYTRNGQFKVSSAGNIVNDQGNHSDTSTTAVAGNQTTVGHDLGSGNTSAVDSSSHTNTNVHSTNTFQEDSSTHVDNSSQTDHSIHSDNTFSQENSLHQTTETHVEPDTHIGF